MKKRAKNSFSGISRNVLLALLVLAAAITVYGVAEAAVVSHQGSEIVGQVSSAAYSEDSGLLQGLSSADILAASATPPGFFILGPTTTSPEGYVYTGEKILTTVEKWNTRAPLSIGRIDHAVAAVNNKLYVIGGRYLDLDQGYNGQVTGTVKEYKPATDSWINKAQMPTPRYDAAVAVVNNKIYVIGGVDANFEVVSTNEEYDPATNTWTTKAPMTGLAAADMAAAAANNKIYVMSSIYHKEYDPATNTWTTKAPMPTPRSDLAAASVNGKVYAFGGYDGDVLATNEEYDPATNTWTTKAPMLTAQMNLFAVTAPNNRIHVMSGNVNNGKNDEYDPATNTWAEKLQKPGMPRWGAAMNNSIYAVGGGGGGAAKNWEYYLGKTFYLHQKTV